MLFLLVLVSDKESIKCLFSTIKIFRPNATKSLISSEQKNMRDAIGYIYRGGHAWWYRSATLLGAKSVTFQLSESRHVPFL